MNTLLTIIAWALLGAGAAIVTVSLIKEPPHELWREANQIDETNN